MAKTHVRATPPPHNTQSESIGRELDNWSSDSLGPVKEPRQQDTRPVMGSLQTLDATRPNGSPAGGSLSQEITLNRDPVPLPDELDDEITMNRRELALQVDDESTFRMPPAKLSKHPWAEQTHPDELLLDEMTAPTAQAHPRTIQTPHQIAAPTIVTPQRMTPAPQPYARQQPPHIEPDTRPEVELRQLSEKTSPSFQSLPTAHQPPADDKKTSPSFQSLPAAHQPPADDKKTIPEGRPSPMLTPTDQFAKHQTPLPISKAPTEPILRRSEHTLLPNQPFATTDPPGGQHLFDLQHPTEGAQEPMSTALASSSDNSPSLKASRIPRPKLDEGFRFAKQATLPPVWRRFLAGLIDFGLLAALAFFCTLLFGPSTSKPFPKDLHGLDLLATFIQQYNSHIFFSFICYAILYFFYATIGHALFGKTLGKALMFLRVVDRSGNPPGWIGSISRSLAFLLFFFMAFVGVTWILVDREYRGLYDKIAGSLVVRS